MSWVLWGLAAVLLGGLAGLRIWQSRHPELRWDWKSIDLQAPRFPPGFVWGVATAAHQVEGGCDNNNWSRWEQAVDGQGRPRVKHGHRAGAACEHWSRFREDIGLIRELGVSHYRYSVEWSKVEPRKGGYDEAVLRHYHEVCDAVLSAGLEPVVTLHHFTHPLWLEDLQSFEKPENIGHLIDFGTRVFREYGDKVRMWCTINEPEVLANMGWAAGVFPPGKRDIQKTGEVLRNLMEAHTQLYQALKAQPGGEKAQVGLAKNICQFDPWNRWSPLDWALSSAMNRIYNDAILDYLRTGRFELRIPGLARVEHENPAGPRSLDYIGLNYYSHIHVQLRPSKQGFLNDQGLLTMRYPAGAVMTDMPYEFYAEGLYRALQDVQKLGKPIYVTENGIADARDDRRERFIEEYLYALWKAMQEGCDVRGYFYWSLMDNFEWAEGYTMRFGLYEVDYATQRRTLRKGAQAFVRRVKGEMGP